VSSPTRIVFVLHNRERNKPTNTGRIVHGLLANSELIYYGVRDQPFDTGPLDDPETDYHVLFPRDDATTLQPEDPAIVAPPTGRRAALVVLDGTWHQCSRMYRRAARIQSFPCVALPPGPPSRWGVRQAHQPGYLCTYEAVVRALGLLHGDASVGPLAAFFERLRVEMMAMKGKPPVGERYIRWSS
jgi:DTW domain-containing protein YfiP